MKQGLSALSGRLTALAIARGSPAGRGGSSCAAVNRVTWDERARDRIALPTERDVPRFREFEEIAREGVVIRTAALDERDERGRIRFIAACA